jgi:hypothetical protein
MRLLASPLAETPSSRVRIFRRSPPNRGGIFFRGVTYACPPGWHASDIAAAVV